jgi:hypothetical protein
LFILKSERVVYHCSKFSMLFSGLSAIEFHKHC